MSVMTGKSHLQSNRSLAGPLSPIQADRNYRIFFFLIVDSDKVASPPVITANAVWKEFKTMLKARLKHVATKDKRWVDKVRMGDTSQTHADQAMTKMRAEAAEAKVVLIEWNTPESFSPNSPPWFSG